MTAEGKIAGILMETSPAPSGGFWFALGIGVNLASAPDQIDQRAAALPSPVAAPLFLSALSLRLAMHAAPLDRGSFVELRRAWLSRAVGLGGRVTTLQGDRYVEGRFVDLAEDGALVIETNAGMSRISAGDVLFAPARQA
jgi:BirA family biotin operon repressor/biotin-[acetyl-CoA-carboxylase] ligase